MTAERRSPRWGRMFVEAFAGAGLEAVVIAPGSRSTPLALAFASHPEIDVYRHLDERAAAYFALGRGRRTGEPTAVLTTSGTATANLHPAVIEADVGRVPLIVLTADRPAALRDSGANQTIDQVKLYGDAVRWFFELPEPSTRGRAARALRTVPARAMATATGTPPGPVHLNCPFPKPLEPADPGSTRSWKGDAGGSDDANAGAIEPPEDGDRPGGPLAVRRSTGTVRADRTALERVTDALATADRPLLVAGPADPAPEFGSVADEPGTIADEPGTIADESGTAAFVPETADEHVTVARELDRIVGELGRSIGTPILADPLSGVRFGPHVEDAPILGGYDAFLDEDWPAPDAVVRVGASPTSRTLREYLARCDGSQFLVDPAGEWREATFTATDLIVGDPRTFLGRLRAALADRADSLRSATAEWRERFETAERRHWERTDALLETPGDLEGAVLATVFERAPDPATVVVSNSMPVRDADRFARPRPARRCVIGNRGASGIDGMTSTALGAASATEDPVVLVTGDLAFYHDLTGLIATQSGWNRPLGSGLTVRDDSSEGPNPGDGVEADDGTTPGDGVEADDGLNPGDGVGAGDGPTPGDGVGAGDASVTIVVVNNDGGGIFHMLPIEAHDPPFTALFKTPHGLSFEPVAELFELEYAECSPDGFEEAFRETVTTPGTNVLEVSFDAAASHRRREGLEGDP